MVDSVSVKQIAASKITFAAEEKELLVSLLKHENIEDKRTNKSTNKLKARAWNRISKRYNNCAFVTKRETIQLRRCWEKIKRITKYARSKEIKTRMATGGGSPPQSDFDYVPGVDEVVPHLMYKIPSTVDSDTVFKIERQTETQMNILQATPFQEDTLVSSDTNIIVAGQSSPVAIFDKAMMETWCENGKHRESTIRHF